MIRLHLQIESSIPPNNLQILLSGSFASTTYMFGFVSKASKGNAQRLRRTGGRKRNKINKSSKFKRSKERKRVNKARPEKLLSSCVRVWPVPTLQSRETKKQRRFQRLLLAFTVTRSRESSSRDSSLYLRAIVPYTLRRTLASERSGSGPRVNRRERFETGYGLSPCLRAAR